MTSVYSTYDTLNAHQRPTVGDSKFSAVNVDHMGWLKCDGRTLNVSDYYFLWQVIGYSYGGSDAQFMLPNPAGRVPGVIGAGADLTERVLGDSLGEEEHVLSIPEMPSHSHTGTTSNSTTGITTNATGANGAYGVIKVAATGDGNVTAQDTTGYDNTPGEPNLFLQTGLVITDPGHNHTFTTSNTGGNTAHNNMQPTLFMGNMFIYCGKANEGSYPYFVGGLF